MNKFFNKWSRKFHRWIAIPTLILIPLAVISKFAGESAAHLPPQVEQFQSVLMLFLAISGAYLYLIPYIARRRRNKSKQAQQAAVKQRQ